MQLKNKIIRIIIMEMVKGDLEMEGAKQVRRDRKKKVSRQVIFTLSLPKTGVNFRHTRHEQIT